MNALLALCLLCQPAPPDLTPRTFDVRAYGAVPDDAGFDDRAVNAAVSACAAAGGGVVSLPRGRYLLDAPVNVRDCTGVTLRGDGPATVLGSGNYCGPLVAVGLPCASAPAGMRPASPLTTSGPKRSVATLGAMALAVTGHPLQFGWTSPGSVPDYWAGGGAVTVDVALSRPPGAAWPQWTNLFGFCSPPDAPIGMGVVRFADGMVVWDVQGEGGARRRLAVPVDPEAALWRVSMQVDCRADRAAAWVGGRLVASGWEPAWTVNPGPFALLKHDGVTPFSVGYPAPRADGNGPGGIADLVLHGLRVCRAAVYQWDGPNPGAQAFAVQPALPLTDDTRFFSGADQVVPPGSLVGLLPMDPEAPGSAWVSCSSYRGRGLMAWVPPGRAVTVGTNRVVVEQLRLAGAVQPTVLTGRAGHVTLREVVSDGASQALGALPYDVSYPYYLERCDFSGWDAPIVSFWQIVEARGLVLSGVGRHGVRTVGGTGLWDGVKVWRLAPYTESVFRHVGTDDGLDQAYRAVLVDNEDFAPSVAVLDVERAGAQPGAVLVDGMQVNTPDPAPLVRLSGAGPSPYRASLRRLSAFSGARVALSVEGPGWHGDADLSAMKGSVARGELADFAVTPPSRLFGPAPATPAAGPKRRP